MALATIDDLAALGALPMNAPDGRLLEQAHRLLELASAQVVTELGAASETAVTTGLTASQLTALSAVVAEAAGMRLQNPLARNTEFVDNVSSAILNMRHIRAIRRITGRGATFSIEVERDATSSYINSTVADWETG